MLVHSQGLNMNLLNVLVFRVIMVKLMLQISQLVEDVQRLQASLKKLQETTSLQVWPLVHSVSLDSGVSEFRYILKHICTNLFITRLIIFNWI